MCPPPCALRLPEATLKIILDTNVIQEDFLMKSGRFELLLDYARKTDSQVILPRLVLEELAANYERELASRFAKLLRAKDQLHGITLDHTVPHVDLDISAEVAKYIEHVRARLEVSESDIAEYKEAHLRDAITRGLRRQRPCTDRGEEIRDAVLWNIVLDLAAMTKERVAFISKNTAQFTDDKVLLHPDLLAEVGDKAVRIDYYPSLEEFGRAHATRIAFATKAWIQTQIQADDILERGVKLIEASVVHKLEHRSTADDEFTGYVQLIGCDLEVDEFFVYEMEDGTFRIEATWFGVIEVEYEAEVTEEVDDWEYEYAFDSYGNYSYQPTRRGRASRRSRTKTTEVETWVVVEARARDNRIEDWSPIEAWLA